MNTEDKFYFGKPGQPERFGYSYRPSNILAADLDYAISEIQKDMRHMTQVMQNVIKKNPLDAGWIWETDALHNNLLSFIDRARGVLRHKDSQVQAKAKKAVGEVRAFLDKWEKMQARSRSGKAPFSRPSQPERFGAIEEAAKIRISDIQSGNAEQLNKIEPILRAAANMGDERAARYLKMLRFERKHLGTSVPEAPWHRSSRPGQPERFGRNYSGKSKRLNNGTTVAAWDDGDAAQFVNSTQAQAFSDKHGLGGVYQSPSSRAFFVLASKATASRPGQPDTFDASSLKRGDFAEASKSPILGKLLSDKAMPDGGWRAVQVGSDTLVISFEDADLATDFGRRVASKGYSATSPVATTGRYWNVEVKHGK